MLTLSQFKCEAQASSSILYVVFDEACKMTKKCMMPTVHSIAALQGFSCRTCVSAPVHHQSPGPVFRSASAAFFRLLLHAWQEAVEQIIDVTVPHTFRIVPPRPLALRPKSRSVRARFWMFRLPRHPATPMTISSSFQRDAPH